MESMVPKRLWLGLTVSLALVVLLAMALAPWAGLLDQPDHSHIGSPIASDNSRDISYLDRNAVGVPDAQIRICDQSYNDKKALGRAFDGGGVYLAADDEDGAYGICYRAYSSRNGSEHDACNWRYDSSTCGPDSQHGS